LAVWKKIVAGYRIDLFCGLYLERSNRGITLAPKTLSELGARGIELGFDIYAPEEPIQRTTDNDGAAPRRV
jgi:ribosomal protein L19